MVIDTLKQLFDKQKQLNDRTFQKNGIFLKMDNLIDVARHEQSIGPNNMVNEWLKKYLWALKDEVRELDEELLNKWWSDDTLDMQNIRVEIVDIFHFAISLAMAAGMESDELMDLYIKKGQVNHQ